MWLIHHVSENLILNQGCLQKYNYNENIHVDNNKIRTQVFNLGSSGEVGSLLRRSSRLFITSSISAGTCSLWSLRRPVGMWCDAALNRTVRKIFLSLCSLLEENTCSGRPLLPGCIHPSWPFLGSHRFDVGLGWRASSSVI